MNACDHSIYYGNGSSESSIGYPCMDIPQNMAPRQMVSFPLKKITTCNSYHDA